MDSDEIKKLTDNSIEEKLKEQLTQSFDSKRKRIFSKIFGAALGSIPWVGGFLSAMNDLKADNSQIKSNQIYQQWLEEHKSKMNSLAETLLQVMKRLDEFNDEINNRLESEEYMKIVRKSFRSWDKADTQDKRELVRKLLTNSGAYSTVPDDLIRLFLDWIDLYHEIHFAVIKVIYKNPGVTRLEIWKEIDGKSAREDSLEADLFKLLIRDLSTGGVIRQHRQIDYYGNFMKKPVKKAATTSKIMKSAFEDGEGYELTELGQQFVSYSMNEIITRIN